MKMMIGVMQEWNREMLIERVNAGLSRTIENGTKLGRKNITNPKMTSKIIALRGEKIHSRDSFRGWCFYCNDNEGIKKGCVTKSADSVSENSINQNVSFLEL